MTIPSYPMRPMNGGPLPIARPKRGEWAYEPKFNGWRTIVHAPTGAMFNRKGEPMSIEHEFSDVLSALRDRYIDLKSYGLAPEWLDCEALERRHKLGQGSLIVFDYIPQSYDKTRWDERQQLLYETFIGSLKFGGFSYAFDQIKPPENKLLFPAYHYSEDAEPYMTPAMGWKHLQEINKAYGCQFFEGLVAKRLDSPYTTQLRSFDIETPNWIKHRWEF